MVEVRIRLRVNGEDHEVDVPIGKLLRDVLREDLGLLSVRYGCDTGDCGMCTILLDGKPVRSCLLIAPQAEGHEIWTLEGLKDRDPVVQTIIEAFAQAHATQCGYCSPAFILITKYFLERNPNPTREEVRKAVSAALCRCTGYKQIVDGVLLAARMLREGGVV
ncbi:MAG TPA: (2Fe-2S)-binding protein [Aciduliprofundum sp.]|nr:(2Fe-2S)-binding protein [Aciduliprofundum sp.]